MSIAPLGFAGNLPTFELPANMHHRRTRKRGFLAHKLTPVDATGATGLKLDAMHGNSQQRGRKAQSLELKNFQPNRIPHFGTLANNFLRSIRLLSRDSVKAAAELLVRREPRVLTTLHDKLLRTAVHIPDLNRCGGPLDWVSLLHSNRVYDISSEGGGGGRYPISSPMQVLYSSTRVIYIIYGTLLWPVVR